MPWMFVDDQMHAHRKFLKLGADRMAATGLWTTAGSWASGQMSDGFVPSYVIEQWDPDLRLALRLHAVELWVPAVQDGDDGYRFHDWLDRNHSREEIEAKRAATADRVRRWRERKRRSQGEPESEDRPGDGVSGDAPVTRYETRSERVTNAGVTLPPSHPIPSHPTQVTDDPSDHPSSDAGAPTEQQPERSEERSEQDAVIDELCNLLVAKIVENGFRPVPTVGKTWRRDMRLLIELDERPPVKVRKMIEWLSGDEFWAPNVKSPGKLRAQWDKLAAKANSEYERARRNGGAIAGPTYNGVAPSGRVPTTTQKIADTQALKELFR